MLIEGDTIQFKYKSGWVIGEFKASTPAKVALREDSAFYDLTVRVGATIKVYRSIADEEIAIVRRAS